MEQILQRLKKPASTKIVLYLSGFGVIIISALLNPSGFLSILSVFGSFALNVECGIFVSLMAEELPCANTHFNGKFMRDVVDSSQNSDFKWSYKICKMCFHQRYCL